MSSYIVDDKTINRILCFICWHREKYPSGLRELQDIGFSVETEESVKRIGGALKAMNVKAVGQRYDHRKPTVTDYVHRDVHITEMQFLKSLHCFLYQCLEGTVPKMKLYKIFKDIEHTTESRIISAIPEYEAAEWA